MRKTSLTEAKAQLSSLVDEAEHHKRRIIILRHGKPAAAIVPIEVAIAEKRRPSATEIDDVFAALGKVAPEAGAVDDVISGRR